MSALLDAAGQALMDALGSRLDFDALLGDGDRLLQVDTALPALALLPEHCTLDEAVSRPFELVLDAVSTSAQFELKTLLGEQMTVRLKRADGSYLSWHGYVLQAAQLGSDGGLARYRLVMGPWLAWLRLRTDSFVFQDLTALDIVEQVFADYPQAQWRLAIGDETRAAMAVRPTCTQYRESDLAFVERLLAQEGLHWWFEHLDAADSATADAQGKARHRLVIADGAAPHDDLGPVRFAARHPTAFLPGLEDPITDFAAQRRWTSDSVTVGRWDERQLAGHAAQAYSSLDLGQQPALPVYDGAGVGHFETDDQAEAAAARALSALSLQAKRFDGTGGARALRAGARFALVDHPAWGANTSAPDYAGALLGSHARGDNGFTVLAVRHEAANNLGSQAARLLKRAALERGAYANRFHCVAAAAPIAPRWRAAPTAPAALTARVVGLADTAVMPDRDHRVKVQFHFQRGESPNAGGMTPGFGTDDVGNAPGDERAGAWVRVAGPAAGADWGSVYTPRIGAEVAVQFLDGDIDRPVIAGGLYDGLDAQPFAAGEGSGANHPGTIAGLHSTRLDDGGFHQWAADDATGQLRTRLHASQAASELSLGHLIQQSGDDAYRGAWRGTGFEAGTAGWSAVRGAQGLLLTSTMRGGTGGSATGTQMESDEALERLAAAQAMSQALAQAAGAVGSQPLSTPVDGGPVDTMMRAIDPTRDGHHPDTVNGQQALKPGADGRTPGSDPVPAFATPLALLDTPSALLAATPASLAMFSGAATSLAAHGDLHLAAVHTLSAVSGGTTSLFTHEGGLNATTANGPLQLRAHTDALQVLADQSVNVRSVGDELRVSAQQRIKLAAGESSVTLEGGDITIVTPGAFTVKGATHAFEAAASAPASLPALPTGGTAAEQTTILLDHRYHDDQGLAGADYEATFEDGSVMRGTLDGSGRATLTGTPSPVATVTYGPSPQAFQRVDVRPTPDHDPDPADDKLAALVEAYAGDMQSGGAS